jgi:ABC-type branched-subunit amino acid transport system substrate-binding protein
VETVLKDDQTTPTAGVDAAKKLIEIDKVPAIVGALSSGVTIAVAESAAVPNKVVLISPASTSPALAALKDDNYVYRTTPSDALQGVVLGKLAYDLGFKKAASLYVNNAYGQGLADEFAKAYAKLGGKATASVAIEQEQPSYDAELKKATADNPDVLLCLSYPESAKIYLKQAIEKNYAKKFLFCDGVKSPELIKAIGASYLEGMYGTAAAVKESDVTKWFADTYKASYGELPPKPYIGEAYDATVIIALAAQKAGKADGTAIRDAIRFVANPPGEKIGPRPEDIKRAIQLIKEGKDIDYDGVAGPQDFLDNGDVISTIQVWKIVGGEIVADRYELPAIQ